MKNRIIPAATVTVLLAFSGAVTFALHRLGEVRWLSVDWSHLRQWLDSTPPPEALLSAARLVGLACGWWIFLSTCFYLAAGLSRVASALRFATPITLPFIRTLSARLVVGAVAATTLGSSLPAAASTAQPVVNKQPTAFSFPLPVLNLGEWPGAPATASTHDPIDKYENRKIIPPLPYPLVTGPVDIPEKPVAGSPASQSTPGNNYRIARGDNLWKIAQRILSQSMPSPPTTQQIASYWVDLIETNRETIRSGDPDLIYPDETILLPEIRELTV